MKISQDKPFTGTTLKGANGKIFAVTDFEIIETEDSTNYQAEAIEIKSIADASEAIKKHKLDTITSTTKSFYGDGESRGDLALLLVLKLSESLDEDEEVGVKWKTKDGVIEDMTFGDVVTALKESLLEKGNIVL